MTQSSKNLLLSLLCLLGAACGRSELLAGDVSAGPVKVPGGNAISATATTEASGLPEQILLGGEEASSASRRASDVHSLEVLGARLVRCSVRPYGIGRRGQKIYGPLRSTCSEVVVDGSRVRVQQVVSEDGSMLSWEIRVLPSSPTHGRNLWDVVIWDQDGRKVLEATAIPGARVASPLDLTLSALELTPELSVYDSSLNQQ